MRVGIGRFTLFSVALILCAALFLVSEVRAGDIADSTALSERPPTADKDISIDAWRQERERGKKAYEERVQNESLEESVINLYREPLSEYHYRLASTLTADPSDVIRALMKEPRAMKVMRAAEKGTEDERNAILREVTTVFEEMISGLPAVQLTGDAVKRPSVYMPNGAVAYPVLLLRVDEGADTLPLLIRVSDFLQEVSKSATPRVSPEEMRQHANLFPGGVIPTEMTNYVGTLLGDMIAFAVRHMLDRYCDRPEMQARLTARQKEQVQVYLAYRERVGAQIKSRQDEIPQMAEGLAHVAEEEPELSKDHEDAVFWALCSHFAAKPEGDQFKKMSVEEIVITLARAVIKDQ